MKFAILALFVAGAYGCGQSTFPPVLSRVVGGNDARKHSWPWQVSLQYSAPSGNWYHTCGGTLISDQWVLTAAHCIGEKKYRVYLGKHSMRNKQEPDSIAISPSKLFTHPEYDSWKIRNDIALIKLSTPVTFTDVLPHGQPCYVTGWGHLETIGPMADILQQALLPVVKHEICSTPDWMGGMVTTNNICAGGDGKRGGCKGDSGGPLNCQGKDGSWEVHGVVSFCSSFGCNYHRKPTVFTRVSAYMDWLNRVRIHTIKHINYTVKNVRLVHNETVIDLHS
uniref:pancreatic elastase II n=1 Tax=Periophthalmus magnuspinnatus TaxID=409849 RepID=A0A3B4AQP6_9GOBI